MNKGLLRVGVVGSSSLLGKELMEELADSVLGVVDVILLEQDVEVGQVTAAGDEATFVQRIETGSFDGMDLCFFAGSADDTLRHWEQAKRAGAAVVDLTGALDGKEGVSVRSPWVADALGKAAERVGVPDRTMIAAHPVAAMLGLVSACCTKLGLMALAATVLEPASERGASGMDEMHQQTVKLLSFQGLPQEEYDAQVAFNLVPSLGPAARKPLVQSVLCIQRDYRLVTGGSAASLALQVIHAPVFHGYGISLVLDFERAVAVEEVAKALSGGHIELIAHGVDGPTNVGAAGNRAILVRLGESQGTRLMVWMMVDNLKLRVLQSLSCAEQLIGARPLGTVQ